MGFRSSKKLGLVSGLVLILSACGTTSMHTTEAMSEQSEATTRSAKVHEYFLKNGLKLIVKEDHRAPVVVSQIWYKIGPSYEYGGITGVSHVLEHMMFKGTRKHAAGEFSRIISEHGGRENAFTGPDYTAYFQQLEASRLPISFEMESDRMRNLLLPEDEFLKEVKVVMEERRMRTEDKPGSLTYEQFKATAFQSSPYQQPIIGWMNDLENLTVADLRSWYRQWYAPNNATVIVVGDVNPDEVFKLAKKYFGSFKPSTIVPAKPRLEPEQKGERRITVKAPAELPVLIMGYKTPVLKTVDEPWKAYALEMVAGVLSGGKSARLSKELVRGKQLANSAGAGYSLASRLDSLFILEGVPAKGHTVAELEQALREQVERLSTELVDEVELERIKAQVVAAKVYEQDSVFYQAMQMGILETVDLSWQVGEDYVENLRAITAEQIRQVAREFLVGDGLTVGVLDPQPIDKAAGHKMSGGHNGSH